MVSNISSSGAAQAYQALRPAKPQVSSRAIDNDGDRDGSKSAETESKNRPVSATIGNTINTTA